MGTADGFEVEGNLKKKKKDIHVEITPLLSLSSLTCSIQSVYL